MGRGGGGGCQINLGPVCASESGIIRYVSVLGGGVPIHWMGLLDWTISGLCTGAGFSRTPFLSCAMPLNLYNCKLHPFTDCPSTPLRPNTDAFRFSRLCRLDLC